MTALADIAKTGKKVEGHRPWPRAIVTGDSWKLAIKELVEARATLLGLWGDKDAVHLALIEEPSGAIGTVPSSTVSWPACTMCEWDERVVSARAPRTRIARIRLQSALVLRVNRTFWQNRNPVAPLLPRWLRSKVSARTGGRGRGPRNTGE